MEIIDSNDKISGIKENKIIGNFILKKSKVQFRGKGNILITPCNKGGVTLENTTIYFEGDNSIVFLDNSQKNLA